MCEDRRQGTYVEKTISPNTIASLVEKENPFSGDGYQRIQHSST
jgi:hypothetical protein